MSGDRKWMDGISFVCMVLWWDVAPVKLSRLLANMLLGVGWCNSVADAKLVFR